VNRAGIYCTERV